MEILASQNRRSSYNTHMEPNAVPRIVWGLKNLQQASLKSDILLRIGPEPAAPTRVQAWKEIKSQCVGLEQKWAGTTASYNKTSRNKNINWDP